MNDSITKHIKQDALFCSNKFIHDSLEVVRYIGMDEEQFLAGLGLVKNDLVDHQGLVPRQCIYKSYDLLLNYSQDELLGVGEKKLPIGGVDLMVKIASVDKTLEQGLCSIDKIVEFSQSKINPSIVIDGDLVRWRFSPKVVDQRFLPFIITICLSVGIRILSLLIKLDIPLITTSFTFDKPSNVSDYQFLFSNQVLFNQQHNELCFKKDFLKKTIQVDYHQVRPLLKSPLSLISYIKRSMGLSKQVEDILASYPNANFPKPCVIAEQLGMSLRKMQRKLEQENCGYMQLKDLVRQQKAEFYLIHTEKDISIIAQRCGFSEVTSFNRTFKRWTQITPLKFRLRNSNTGTNSIH